MNTDVNKSSLNLFIQVSRNELYFLNGLQLTWFGLERLVGLEKAVCAS